MDKMQEYLVQADKDLAILVCSGGELESGQVYWAYAAILPSRYRALKEAEKANGYDLADYGDVLFWGYGALAPEAKEEIDRLLSAHNEFEQQAAQNLSQYLQKHQPGFAGKILARRLLR